MLSGYQEATIKVVMVIATDDSVRDVEVGGLSGNLSTPIKKAILGWKFKPTIMDGKPTEVVTEFCDQCG